MLLVLLTALAHAQATPGSSKVIEAPLPPPDQVGNPDAPQPTNQVVAPLPPELRAPAPTVHREPRKVQGVAPTSLWGRWSVVQITDLGETEDFKSKMERSAMALEADCKTVALVFDFGPKPATPALPRLVQISERRECYKGGLGKYLSELTLESNAAWGANDQGQVVLKLPEMRADATLVRLRLPENSDMQTPPQWLGPDTRQDRQRAEYVVLEELGRGREAEAPTVVHLTTGNGTTMHLEPLEP